MSVFIYLHFCIFCICVFHQLGTMLWARSMKNVCSLLLWFLLGGMVYLFIVVVAASLFPGHPHTLPCCRWTPIFWTMRLVRGTIVDDGGMQGRGSLVCSTCPPITPVHNVCDVFCEFYGIKLPAAGRHLNVQKNI